MDVLAGLLPVVVVLASALCGLVSLLAVAVGAYVWLRRSKGTPAQVTSKAPAPAAARSPRVGGAMDTSALQRMYTETLGYEAIATDDPAFTHMVRQCGAVAVHLESRTVGTGTGTEVSYGWRTPTPSALQVHVLEATVANRLSRAVRDGAMGRHRTVKPMWPQSFPTGDPALDARFVVYAPSAQAAVAACALREELLALPYVELQAGPDGAVLSDPFQQGLLDRVGGPMGMMRVATPGGIAIQLQLHEEAAALLCGAVDPARTGAWLGTKVPH